MLIFRILYVMDRDVHFGIYICFMCSHIGLVSFFFLNEINKYLKFKDEMNGK